MKFESYREIPYNYTSADDKKIIEILFSEEMWNVLEKLRRERVTGRSARLLMRIIGELFIHFRNPYLKHHLVESFRMKKNFFTQIDHDFAIVKKQSNENKDVLHVIQEVESKINELKSDINETISKQEKISKELGGICGKENIFFDPFTIISHATDATDWRLHLPFAVIRPYSTLQIPAILKAIDKIGYKVIICGGLTGLTGGAVPLAANCIILNTEKLNKIFPIADKVLKTNSGNDIHCKSVKVEAGVITEDAIKAMHNSGYVFATDPTSAWASTIGGNIAENAGGKHAVKWGTTIDNILSYEFVSPQGDTLSIERTNHQYRKIMHEDTVLFRVTNKNKGNQKEISLRGDELRKPGLWKDITNKVLGGVPGLQKEGTDGVILSAEFILYPTYIFEKTFCIEFFGENFNEAGRIIVEISNSFSLESKASLLALEHFDQEYIKAINYRVKSDVNQTPKAVLLIDMAANKEEDLIAGVDKLISIIHQNDNTKIHTAKDKREGNLFWNDRKHLGAIAKRTNAFKLNEDIVLPLASISEFCNWVDEINVREERFIQNKFLNTFEGQLHHIQHSIKQTEIHDKIDALLKITKEAKEKILHLDKNEIQSRSAMLEFRTELKVILRGYESWIEKFQTTFTNTINTVLIIATHMHAGDGNIHVNIPVFSNDLEMMKRAEHLVDEVMEKTVELKGVVSGEHGIGITKIKYLEDSTIEELKKYRAEIDPKGMMNPEKLVNKSIINKVFTPSFNLLELEARILKYGNLETLATKIANCVRCGKCKADCCVFHPAQNMFFHPRNKNLAIGSLIEAVLFEVQRYRNISFELLRHLEEIADNCTICHKCKIPCPVKIDTGEISILERNLLVQKGIKRSSAVTELTLDYLSSTSPAYNRLIHSTVLAVGGRLQSISSYLASPFQSIKPISKTYAMRMLQVPMMKSSFKILHDYLPECNSNQILMFEGSDAPEKTIFYFPGCGSERMFSDISLAGLYLLLKSKARVIIPPPYLCCGFPFSVNGKEEEHSKIVLRNLIIFNQIKEMFKYLNFNAVSVTCGTCKEALEHMGVGEIFETKVNDILNVVDVAVNTGEKVLYHRPCHDSLENKGIETIKEKIGCEATLVPHCCSEAGTLALSRPEISSNMRKRKTEALKNALDTDNTNNVILTNCPSCVQGLGKQRRTGIKAEHVMVYMARKQGGEDWKKEAVLLLKNFDRVTF
ncbi:MAG: DUF3683 domain-containing protein [Leptospiraceae bacterium]|nr:DUF3683 domain-containing protein [Leptospiraceae bacterium]